MAEGGVAVVTGATSGIGQWIALGLAREGRHVVLAGRSEARLGAIRDWIAHRVPGAALETMRADLSSLAETRGLAAAIASRHSAISLLVNNAGLMTRTRMLTAEGREMVLAVNHLAPHVLTGALEAALRAGAPARIVNIGSTASDRATLDLDDLGGERRWAMLRAYAQSKLALMMATFERARQLGGTGVTANVAHPGVVATGIGDLPGIVGFGWRALGPLLLTPVQGAETPLHVALAPELARVSGRYFKKKHQVAPNPRARDEALLARLWDTTEQLAAA